MSLLPSPGKYCELPPRALIDRRDAINHLLKPKQQIELRAVLYAYGLNRYILSATTGVSEAGKPIVFDVNVSDHELGLAILDSLLQCYAHEPPDPKDYTLSDWAVYVASGAKSGRSFEESSIYVSIRTVNTGIVIEASRRKPSPDYYVGCGHSIVINPETLGSSVRGAISRVRLLDKHDAL